MLREHNKLMVQAHRLLDICLTAAAFIGAYFVKNHLLPAPFRGLIVGPGYHVVLLMIIIIWYVTFGLFDLYASYRRETPGQVLFKMVKAVSTGMLVLILCMYVFKIKDVSRIMIGLFFLLDIGLLALSKGLVYTVLSRYRQKGFNFRNILIVGSRQRAVDVIDAIGDRLGSGYRVLGCLDVDGVEIGKQVKNGIQVIGTIDYLKKILLDQVVDELIFAIPLKKIENAHKYIALAEEVGVLAMNTTPTERGELLIKNAFDYVAGAVGFVVALPVFAVICLAIRLTSKGPVFFKQERSGLNGRRFQLYKFRTMVDNAEELRET